MPFKTGKIYRLKLKSSSSRNEEHFFKKLDKLWREFTYLRTINGNRARMAVFSSVDGDYLETFTVPQLKDHEIEEVEQ